MKNLLLIFAILFSFSLIAQVQPPECSEPGGDTEAPQFTVPDPCDTIIFPGSVNCIFPNFESVPPLYNQPGTAVADIVFETMTDNCMMVYWPPCWCSATMSSGVLDQGEGYIIYSFTAYDVSGNYNTQQITFNYEELVDDIPEYAIERLRVWPNPSNGTFSVNKPDYKVFNVEGKQVEQPLNNGAYVIVSEGQTFKLIVN